MHLVFRCIKSQKKRKERGYQLKSWQISGSMGVLKDVESRQLTNDAQSLFYASAVLSVGKMFFDSVSMFTCVKQNSNRCPRLLLERR